MAQTTHIRSVNVGDGNANCGNISGSFNNIVYSSDEDAQIMRWLSPLEPNNRHQGVRTDRFDGIGDWFLETNEWREWRGGEGGADKAVLFCSGNPGVGKTYLSSLVIDSLCDQARKRDIVVAGLYCDFLAHQEQTITNMMGAILKQLVGRGGIPDNLREVFREGKMEFGGRGLRLPDLMGMLKIAIASLPQVFICIDALDECLPKHLPDLLESLRDIVRESPKTRIFLTGRPHVREDIQRYLAGAAVIPISPNRDDIKNYLEMKLDRDAEPEAMSDDLRADIMRIILDRVSDIFLLVSLNIDAILGEVTIRQRRKKLEKMTQGNGLSDAYTATLTRLKAQKGNRSILGLKVLMWVLHSERPLRTEELCHALGVEVGSIDMDPENVPALRTLLASSLGLVTVEASSSTVRLVHFTLQEHLSSDPTLFHSPHSEMAEVCLTYLNFRCVRDLPPTLLRAPSTMPFLEYASCYWGKHTKRGMTENVKLLALRLLDRFDEHISSQLILLGSNEDRRWVPDFTGTGGPAGFTGLHVTAFLGIVELVSTILGMKERDVNAKDCLGTTALILAVAGGHEEVVQMLLEREDVNPNTADTNYDRTPLFWAAMGGHEGAVRILLERKDVNPNPVDTRYGLTLLSWAAERGHDKIIKALLEREDVNPNTADTNYGQTPLLWPATRGHEGAVRILLERKDVNPNTTDTYGWAPLSWAAENGHEGVVMMLLGREDVNPNTTDTSGCAPLLWAAENGHEQIVKMLLEREDVNPNTADTRYGRTPLSWAAQNGHEGVVKMLLEREDVNFDAADTKYARAPLSWAAENGHEGVMEMLPEREDINPNTLDAEYGQTPLSRALSKGHGVVRTLPKYRNANSETAHRVGQTSPPHGDECVVEMQFGGGDPNASLTDPHDQPALPSPDPDEQEGVLDRKGSISRSASSDLSSTESSMVYSVTLPV